MIRASATDNLLYGELIVDNFAGGGGASLGIEEALGRPVNICINHDPRAIEMHKVNHPHGLHLNESVWKVDPIKVTEGRPVGLAHFSPDCKHFSKAKGGQPVSKRVRGLAWVVTKWAKLVRPRVITLENVEEFLTWGPLGDDGKPDPKRSGETFRRWLNQLKQYGYDVEYKVLCAADYGVPTSRRRLFLIARCDGQPIVWPQPTHARREKARAKGLKPWISAASVIDFSLPTQSIFNRRRPLVDNTMRRIAHGVMRYVIQNKKPFIVRSGHYSNRTGEGNHFRGQSLEKPLATTTCSNDKALVMPSLMSIGQTGGGSRVRGVGEPVPTVTTKNEHCLVSAFMARHYTGSVGKDLREPKPTITAVGKQDQLTACCLTHFYGSSVGGGGDLERPLKTITAGGNHAGLIYAFLMKYYGNEKKGNSIQNPIPTITTKDRIALVTVNIDGEDYIITDIHMRMLDPERELARAQGFSSDYVWPKKSDGTTNKSLTTHFIGNSVPPGVIRAIIAANCADMAVDARSELARKGAA